MSQGPLIFLGLILAMASSWVGLIVTPYLQLANEQPVESVDTGDLYPQMRPGQAGQGADVYRSMGCVACHSQQVGPEGYSSDLERGWGKRRSVARDYLFDQPVFLGSQRVGPDLANIGARQPNADWHLLHLYHPQTVMPEGRKSVMPPYPFLFERRPAGAQPSPDALKLTGSFAPGEGFEIVPTERARQLVAYLLSLRSDAVLFETPVDTPTNAPALTSTNAVEAPAPAP